MQQIISKHIDVFNMSYKKLIRREDKFWSPKIDYHPLIPKIYGLPKIYKPENLLGSIISGIRIAPPHNITKSFAEMLTRFFGTISNSHINNDGNRLNKTNDINMENKSLARLVIKWSWTIISVTKCIKYLKNLPKKIDIALPLLMKKYN